MLHEAVLNLSFVCVCCCGGLRGKQQTKKRNRPTERERERERKRKKQSKRTLRKERKTPSHMLFNQKHYLSLSRESSQQEIPFFRRTKAEKDRRHQTHMQSRSPHCDIVVARWQRKDQRRGKSETRETANAPSTRGEEERGRAGEGMGKGHRKQNKREKVLQHGYSFASLTAIPSPPSPSALPLPRVFPGKQWALSCDDAVTKTQTERQTGTCISC